MVTGYDPAAWERLFASATGAMAGLAGLIFVGLSTNLGAVLELDKRMGRSFLAGRALEAILALLSILVICIVGQTPQIAGRVLAVFILLTAAGIAVSPLLALRASRREGLHRVAMLQRLTFAFALSACLLVCGITLAVGHGGGLFWLPAAVVIAIGVAFVNAWVLLVEVRRGIPVHPRDKPDKTLTGAALPSRPARRHHGTAGGPDPSR